MSDAADVMDVRTRVVGRRVSMWRHGNPLHGRRPDDPEAPTVGRLRHGNGADLDQPAREQKTDRKAFRFRGVMEGLRRKGEVDEDRWIAFQRFERNWHKAAIPTRTVSGYTGSSSGGWNPGWISQLSSSAFDRLSSEEEMRMEAVDHVQSALLALTVPRFQRALVLAVSEPIGLTELGKRLSDYRDPNKCAAIATTALLDGLWLLSNHYSILCAVVVLF